MLIDITFLRNVIPHNIILVDTNFDKYMVVLHYFLIFSILAKLQYNRDQ